MDVVQEIKLRTDLVELISAYVQLRPAGRQHRGLCPFHSEKTPSFYVDRERGFYRCYGCGEGGDCFSFLQKREGLSFNEAGEALARRLGLEWVRRGDTAEKRSQRERLLDINALAERFFRRSLERAPEVQHYLAERGIRPETIERFRLGYAPGGFEALLRWLRQQKAAVDDAVEADLLVKGEHGLRDRFVDRVIFPICDIEGRPIAFGGRTLSAEVNPKYLNTRETPLFQKGRTLYGLHLAKGKPIADAGFTILVEGYIDLIALHQAGIQNSVASLGTAITETHVGILLRYSRELVLCFDGDSAGMRAALRSSAMFETAGCSVRVAALPEGDDPDTYLRKHGAAAFLGVLNRAEPLLDYQLAAVRARYNLSDETARLPFVREAARVIAQSGSHLTRQEYGARLARLLDRLSEDWYPGDPHRALQARSALSQEVNRLLRMDRMSGAAPVDGGRRRPEAGGGASPGARFQHLPSGAPPVPAAPSSRTRAERYVLRAALTEGRWAERVAARLRPGHFAEPSLQGIVRTLLGDNASEMPPAAERAAGVRDDPANAESVSALLIEEAPLSEEGLEECLLLLERARKEDRKREIQGALRSGELQADDPRLEELRALLAELGGSQRRED